MLGDPALTSTSSEFPEFTHFYEIKRIQYGYEWSDYFRGWIPDRDNFDSELTFDEAYARLRHDARKQFAMLMDLDDGSRVNVTSCEGRSCYFVEFLDDQDRIVLRYCFVPTPEGRLFLSQHDEHWYEGDNRMGHGGRPVRFKREEGLAVILRSTRPRRLPERYFSIQFDPTFHDAPMPEFGQWEPLIRRRVMPYELDSRNFGDAS